MKIDSKYWYIIHAPNTKIQDLVKKLRLAVGVENVLFPTVIDRKLNHRKNIYVEKEFPLYFNYIFVKLGDFDPKVEEYLKSNVDSHITLMCKTESKQWAALSDEEVENIRKTIKDANDSTLNVEHDYKVGDKVRILIGPFKAFTGIVTEFKERKKKVVVDVLVFNRETNVEVDIEGCEKI